jgi:hypothetical protein
MSRLVAVAAVLVLAIGACAGPRPAPSPTTATGLEAVVVSTAPGRPDELIVEYLASDGQRRSGATLRLEAETAGLTIRAALFGSKLMHLALQTEVADPDSGDHYGPFLIYDLADPSKGASVLPTIAGAIWGPDGRLLIAQAEGRLAIYDVAKATTTAVAAPEDVIVRGWAADGSGLLAGWYDNATGATTLGVLREDGTFQPGPVQQYLPAGAPRGIGANGEFVTAGHGDPAPGGKGVDFVGVRGPDTPEGQEFDTWYRAVWDTADGRPVAVTFDRAGTGLWLLLDAGTELRLAHLARPQEVEVRMTLADPSEGPVPEGQESHAALDIVGISPDETVVLLQQHAQRIEGAPDLYWLDLRTGASAKFSGWFIGWSGLP